MLIKEGFFLDDSKPLNEVEEKKSDRNHDLEGIDLDEVSDNAPI